MATLESQTRKIFDTLLNRSYEIHKKRAGYLVSAYPQRFKPAGPYQTRKEETMPALPPETEKLTNGTHTLISESHSTTKGQFGEQEEIVCINEATGVHCRVWIPHNSRSKILAAIDCGLAILQGEDWQVLDNQRFKAVVAGGKVVALLKIENNQ